MTELISRLVPELLFARTESGVTGDLPPVVETLPIADLALNDYAAQSAYALGQHRGSRFLQLESKGLDLLIESEEHGR